jgi:hypothetical protein
MVAGAVIFVAGVTLLVEVSFHNSDLYKLSLEQIRSDQRVTELLGSPIESGWFISGELNNSSTTGHGELGYTISGPKAHAEVLVVGDKRFDWKIGTLMVRVDGHSDLVLQTRAEEND